MIMTGICGLKFLTIYLQLFPSVSVSAPQSPINITIKIGMDREKISKMLLYKTSLGC